MIMRMLICLLGALSLWTCAAESLTESYQTLGKMVVTNFAGAPFPHSSRANGHQYQAQSFPAAEHYSDNRVAIFIPRGFQARDHQVDVVIHFHGWRSELDRMVRKFQLIEQFAESGRNAILVVPQGPKDAPDSFGGKLEDAGGFKAFLEELTSVLHRPDLLGNGPWNLGRIALSGHSGGYQVISSIVDHGGSTNAINEVWLFDALYAQSERFLAWQAKTQGRLLNIHTPGGGTRKHSLAMMEELKGRHVPFWSGDEATVNDDQLRTNRIVFLATDMGHNDVLAKHQTFKRFLTTSGLEMIAP